MTSRLTSHVLSVAGFSGTVLGLSPQQIEYLALLVPDAACLLPRHPLEYALAYIERYQDHLLQLEHEWDFLCAMVNEAWLWQRYEAVVLLVQALAYPAGRRDNLLEGEYILRLGIVASRRLADQQSQALFLSRLGGLRFARGKYQSGQRIWQAGLHLALSTNCSTLLWQPFICFAQIADILDNPAQVQTFAERVQEGPDLDSWIVALFVRGLYKRFLCQMEAASADFHACLRLFSSRMAGLPWLAEYQLFASVLQVELARSCGDYARSQRQARSALALARLYSDRYTVAALLVDQGLFTFRQGKLVDTRTTYARLHRLLRQIDAPHVVSICRFLAHHLTRNGLLSTEESSHLLNVPSSLEHAALLSEREREVLQLLARGLTNREIAASLVIAPATVKKHLEHIYISLDVHSRTSAIAKARELNLLS